MTHIFAKHHWKASHPRNKKQKGTLRSAVCVGASTEGGARAWGGRLSRNPAEGPKGRRAALPNGGGGGVMHQKSEPSHHHSFTLCKHSEFAITHHPEDTWKHPS